MKTIASNPVKLDVKLDVKPDVKPDLAALALAALVALDGVVVGGCAEPTCEVCARVFDIAA